MVNRRWCGLVYWLAGLECGLLASAGIHWRIAEMRPGNHPFANLAEALLDESALSTDYSHHFTDHGEAATSLQATLQRGPLSLAEILSDAQLPTDTRLLLLVDQFEELFRYYQQGEVEETAAFVALLLASYQNSNVYVIITMRSDFIGDCAAFYGLPEAVNEGLYLTPRLNREQLGEVMALPATVFGGEVEEGLVNRLINDAGNDPDQLPIVQHALMRMWTLANNNLPEGEECLLTLEHYEQIGGFKKALSNHADTAYGELTAAQQKIAEILFRNLSERDSSKRDTRRPTKLAEIARLAEVEWQAVVPVVEAFRQEGRNFLVPPVGKVLEPETVLDISHESLIRQWQRMQTWLNQEAESAELYVRVEETAQRWKQGKAALWRSPELEHGLVWREQFQPTVQWSERYGQDFALAMIFLEKSEEEQHKEAKAIQKRRRVTFSSMAGSLVIAILLTIFSLVQMNEAKKQTKLAQEQAKKAERLYKKVFKKSELTKEDAKNTAQQFIEEERGRVFRDSLKNGGEGPEMVWLPDGQFRMGDAFAIGDESEQPEHEVSIKRFAMGRYEVTVGEFRQFVEVTGYQSEAETEQSCRVYKEERWKYVEDANWRNPHFPQTNNQPVVCVSWNDVVAYTQWLSKETGQTYRLPSEAEWEYAARAGKEIPYWWGAVIGEGWGVCDGCGSKWDNRQTAPVDSLLPNLFGLYHISGNVEEWVADPWHDNYKDAPNKGQVWETSGKHCQRVSRGGAWASNLKDVRLAYRNGSSESEGSLNFRSISRGFRIARQEKPLVKAEVEAKKQQQDETKLQCKNVLTFKGFLVTKEQAKEVAEQFVKKWGVFQDSLKDGGKGPEMIWLPVGIFQVGDIQGAGHDNEKPVHNVTIKERFAMGRYEVTHIEFARFLNSVKRRGTKDEPWFETKAEDSSSHITGSVDEFQVEKDYENHPVINVSWYGAVAYAEWLTEQTGKQYDLPSEAEWEYAARAGTETKYWWGNEIGEDRANCDNNYCGDNFKRTSPIGYFSANPFGLYDTVGNVWEWVADSWHKDYTNAPNDGRTWLEDVNNHYQVRGGSWSNYTNGTRIAFRDNYSPDNRSYYIGFRVVQREVARIN